MVQLTVGPELFYTFLTLLEETGYFNASLYTPFGIAGVETLGYELAIQMRELVGRDPDVVVCTNAGGGNLTGTARGLQKAGSDGVQVVGASVDLSGLHMASDKQLTESHLQLVILDLAYHSLLGQTVQMYQDQRLDHFVIWTDMSLLNRVRFSI